MLPGAKEILLPCVYRFRGALAYPSLRDRGRGIKPLGCTKSLAQERTPQRCTRLMRHRSDWAPRRHNWAPSHSASLGCVFLCRRSGFRKPPHHIWCMHSSDRYLQGAAVCPVHAATKKHIQRRAGQKVNWPTYTTSISLPQRASDGRLRSPVLGPPVLGNEMLGLQGVTPVPVENTEEGEAVFASVLWRVRYPVWVGCSATIIITCRACHTRYYLICHSDAAVPNQTLRGTPSATRGYLSVIHR